MTHDTQPAKEEAPNAIIERALRSRSQGFGRNRASPAALAGAVAAALREAGYKIVPREVGRQAVELAYSKSGPICTPEEIARCWRAMWDAAP